MGAYYLYKVARHEPASSVTSVELMTTWPNTSERWAKTGAVNVVL